MVEILIFENGELKKLSVEKSKLQDVDSLCAILSCDYPEYIYVDEFNIGLHALDDSITDIPVDENSSIPKTDLRKYHFIATVDDTRTHAKTSYIDLDNMTLDGNINTGKVKYLTHNFIITKISNFNNEQPLDKENSFTDMTDDDYDFVKSSIVNRVVMSVRYGNEEKEV